MAWASLNVSVRSIPFSFNHLTVISIERLTLSVIPGSDKHPSCVTIAPETFQLNDENKALVYDHGTQPEGPTYERWLEVSETEMETILLGAQSCPTLAISIFDESGKQLFPEL